MEIKEETKSLKIPARKKDMVLMRQTLEVAQARSKMCERVEERGKVERRCCLGSVVFRLDLMRR